MIEGVLLGCHSSKAMQNLIIIFASFIAGLICQRWRRYPPQTAAALNAFVISISLPALILLKVPKILAGNESLSEGWIPVAFMWVMFFLGWGVIAFIGRKLQWSRPKIGALALTVGLSNTSFVGLPLLKAVVGDSALPYGILADQLGAFLILSTMGIFVAALYSGSQLKASTILLRVVTFPPFVSLLLSLVWAVSGLYKIEVLNLSLEVLASALVPLALFAVGFMSRFNLAVLKRRMKPLVIGLSLRLFFLPLILFVAMKFLLSGGKPFSLSMQVTILEAAMATQITSSVVANEFNLDGEVANLMVALGVPLSLLTIPLWAHFLVV